MKKWKIVCLAAVMTVSTCLFSGCSGNEGKLDISKVTSDTVLVKKDGKVQAAFIEDFEKDYYNKDELDTYIQNQVEKFQDEKGKEAVSIDNFDVTDKKAKVILTFEDMDAYSQFNSAEAKVYSITDAEKEGILPETFVKASDSSTVNKSELVKQTQYKVLVTKEIVDIKVEGAIQYYSSAVLLNDKTVQTIKDKQSVVVFE